MHLYHYVFKDPYSLSPDGKWPFGFGFYRTKGYPFNSIGFFFHWLDIADFRIELRYR